MWKSAAQEAWSSDLAECAMTRHDPGLAWQWAEEGERLHCKLWARVSYAVLHAFDGIASRRRLPRDRVVREAYGLALELDRRGITPAEMLAALDQSRATEGADL